MGQNLGSLSCDKGPESGALELAWSCPWFLQHPGWIAANLSPRQATQLLGRNFG